MITLKIQGELEKRLEGKSIDDIVALLDKATIEPKAEPTPEPAPQAAIEPAPETVAVFTPTETPKAVVNIETVNPFQASIDSLTAQIQALTQRVDTVVAECEQRSVRAVTAAIAGTGNPAPVQASAPVDNIAKRDFVEMFKENKSKGMNTQQAILAAMQQDPIAHAEWLKSGKPLK